MDNERSTPRHWSNSSRLCSSLGSKRLTHQHRNHLKSRPSRRTFRPNLHPPMAVHGLPVVGSRRLAAAPVRWLRASLSCWSCSGWACILASVRGASAPAGPTAPSPRPGAPSRPCSGGLSSGWNSGPRRTPAPFSNCATICSWPRQGSAAGRELQVRSAGAVLHERPPRSNENGYSERDRLREKSWSRERMAAASRETWGERRQFTPSKGARRELRP